MFCVQCGAVNRDTAQFCSACGAPLYHGEGDQAGNAKNPRASESAFDHEQGALRAGAPKQPDILPRSAATASSASARAGARRKKAIAAALGLGAVVVVALAVVLTRPASQPDPTPAADPVSSQEVTPLALDSGDGEAVDGGTGAGGSGANAASELVNQEDPDEIIANLGPSVDGTGDYASVPDTAMKELWLQAMPQSPNDDVEYVLGEQGEYMRVSVSDRQSSSAMAVLNAVLSGLDAAPDSFFQDASGTWNAGTWKDFGICSRCDADTMELVVLLGA